VRKHQKIPFPVLGGCAGAAGLGGDAQRLSIHSQSGGADYGSGLIEQDVSHPCIVVWVPFNESWGVPNLVETQAHRDYIKRSIM